MKLIANRQLTGAYGTVTPGQHFEVSDEIANDLLRRGLVRQAGVPRIEYDTRAITPSEAPEVSPREPFRHVFVPNTEPADMAAEGDSVLSESDLLEQGIADRGGRRARARSTSGR